MLALLFGGVGAVATTAAAASSAASSDLGGADVVVGGLTLSVKGVGPENEDRTQMKRQRQKEQR